MQNQLANNVSNYILRYNNMIPYFLLDIFSTAGFLILTVTKIPLCTVHKQVNRVNGVIAL